MAGQAVCGWPHPAGATVEARAPVRPSLLGLIVGNLPLLTTCWAPPTEPLVFPERRSTRGRLLAVEIPVTRTHVVWRGFCSGLRAAPPGGPTDSELATWACSAMPQSPERLDNQPPTHSVAPQGRGSGLSHTICGSQSQMKMWGPLLIMKNVKVATAEHETERLGRGALCDCTGHAHIGGQRRLAGGLG